MSDNSWLSAYGELYDPRPAIEAWRAGEEDAARELWEQLYHQGTVNTASYAAVGEIVRMMQAHTEPDWNAYALVSSIEEGRLAAGNPPVPPGLQQDYEQAWATILPMALRDLGKTTDDLVVVGALSAVAHAKGQHLLAEIALLTEDERAEILGR